MIDALDTALADPRTTEALGWIAAGVVFMTFCMKTMPALRVLAVIGNLAFIAYGLAASLTPILLLHGALLPLNLARLAQLRAQIRRLAEAGRCDPGAKHFAWLVEMAKPRRLAAGETLFRKGDPAHSLFVVVSGEVELPEHGIRLGPGALIGELGLLMADNRRTATVRATEDSRLAELTEERVHQLYFDNPRFAWKLIRLVTARLLGNLRRQEAAAEARTAAAESRAAAAEARLAALSGPPPDAADPPRRAGGTADH
ncbi:MAG: cyclic nucleotide-binding domain-containing protein [Paracoccaceae bacterium]